MGSKDMYRSFYLFSRPSFVGGVSRLMDFGSTLRIYNESLSIEEADEKALYLDWKAIADDLRTALKQYKAEQHINE